MPISGLTGTVRALRTAKLKLGYVKRGEKFPRDTDVFVGKTSDGVTPEMIAAYGATPIPDAKEQGVYAFGAELRGMLAFEYDLIGPDGREVVLELLNRSWAASRIRCSGTGGSDEERGVAWVRSPQYRERLQRAGLLLGERKGGWDAACKGRDCPLWYEKADDHDKLPGCHREMRLRFILLHPSRDRDDPGYMRQLGWIEVATGSWNGAVDVQSGLRIIRGLTGGRTAFIPFRLRRVMRSVSAPNGRVNKATLLVDHDADEVLTYASGPPARALLRPEIRRQLAELAQIEAGMAALPPATYAAVADIQPQPDRRALTAPSAPLTDAPAHDRDDALAGAAQSEPETPAAVRLLERDELDGLKLACGGTPGQRETLGRYREMLEAAYLELGVPATDDGQLDETCQHWRPYEAKQPAQPGDLPPPTASAWATTRHREWIEAQVAGGQPGGQGELDMGGDTDA